MRSASRGPRVTAESSWGCSRALGDSEPPLTSVEWDAPSLASLRQREPLDGVQGTLTMELLPEMHPEMQMGQ